MAYKTTTWRFIDGTERDATVAADGVETGDIATIETGEGVWRWSGSAWIAGVFPGNVTLSSASPDLYLGDGTGTPRVIINKSETGVGSGVQFRKLGAQSWLLSNTGSENLNFANNVAGNVLELNQTSKSVRCFAACIIDGDLDHNGSGVGFYGAAPAAKPTVTGSRGGNAALASLLTALATLGLITDSSS